MKQILIIFDETLSLYEEYISLLQKNIKHANNENNVGNKNIISVLEQGIYDIKPNTENFIEF